MRGDTANEEVANSTESTNEAEKRKKADRCMTALKKRAMKKKLRKICRDLRRGGGRGGQ